MGTKGTFSIGGSFEAAMSSPDTTRTRVGSSYLRGIPSDFVRHIPKDMRRASSHNGEGVGAMLERFSEFQIVLMPNGFNFEKEEPWPIDQNAPYNPDQENVVVLATSLAIEGEELTAARWRATIRIDPLNGISTTFAPKQTTLGFQHKLNPTECKKLTERLGELDITDTTSIDLAIKRYLNATTNKVDWSDSIVDAVIGLECLFGGRTEVSLSIASSVANLLGKDRVARKELFESSKKLYNTRSNLVHGNSDKVANLDLVKIRSEALELL